MGKLFARNLSNIVLNDLFNTIIPQFPDEIIFIKTYFDNHLLILNTDKIPDILSTFNSTIPFSFRKGTIFFCKYYSFPFPLHLSDQGHCSHNKWSNLRTVLSFLFNFVIASSLKTSSPENVPPKYLILSSAHAVWISPFLKENVINCTSPLSIIIPTLFFVDL